MARAAETSAVGPEGQRLTVARTVFAPAGEKVRVTGSGYDVTKGIYLAVCQDNGAGQLPTPCAGGADTTGQSDAMKWIGDDPYGSNLAVPWGAGGTFDVEIMVRAVSDGLDCTRLTCSIVTRRDHRGSADRSQDVRIPITFETAPPTGEQEVPPGTVVVKERAVLPAAGGPSPVLLHPESGLLYVGALLGTGDGGLHVYDPVTSQALGRITDVNVGTTAPRTKVKINRIIGPAPGDGVYFASGGLVGYAKKGDTQGVGLYFNVARTVEGAAPGLTPDTVLVSRRDGSLEQMRYAGGTWEITRTAALGVSGTLAVDPVKRVAWMVTGATELRKIDLSTFTATPVTIDTGSTSAPSAIVVDAARGRLWLAVNQPAALVVLDATTGAVLKTIQGDAQRPPLRIRLDPSGSTVYSINPGHPESRIAMFDAASYAPIGTPVTGASNAHDVAARHGGGEFFVTNNAEDTVSRYVRLVSPLVTTQPGAVRADAGARVTFTAAASGDPAPAVRWQVTPDGGQTWTDIEGATSASLSFSARATQNGYAYRAIFTNEAGTTRTSPATLTVTSPSASPSPTASLPSGPSGSGTGTGSGGQKLTVTPINNLDPDGQKVTVKGTGYDESKGIYVAFCAYQGPGELPTPCLGGVDVSGESKTSAWIANDDPYGQGLATPYGPGGSFEVELTLSARDANVDCFVVTCAVVTRVDHRNGGDRSQDVAVRVSFAGQSPVDPSASPSPGSGGGGGLPNTGTGFLIPAIGVGTILIGGGALIMALTRRRRA